MRKICMRLMFTASALVLAIALCAMLPARHTAVWALEQAPQARVSAQKPTSPVGAPAAGEAQVALAGPEEEAPTPGFTDEDAAVLIDGRVFAVRIPADEVLTVLGDDYDYSEMLSCVYDGMDKAYDYGGLIVSTVPAGDVETVEMYTITAADYCTAKSITVGATRDTIIAAYGDGWFDDGYMTYTENGDAQDVSAVRIQFYMENDIAREIYVYSPSY